MPVFTESFRPPWAEREEILYYRDAAKRVGITAARMRRRILKGVRRYSRTVWLEGWYDGRILYTTVQAIHRFMVACDTRPPSLPMPAETPHELASRIKHMRREAAQYGMFAESELN